MNHRIAVLSAAYLAAGAAVGVAGCSSDAKPDDLALDTVPPVVTAPDPDPDTVTTGGPDRWRVTPHGIGPVTVGMSLAEVASSIGASPDIAPADRECSYVRAPAAPEGVAFMVRDGLIARVDVNAPGVLSAEGAGIGTAEADVRRIYGDRLQVQPHKYTDGRYLIVRPAGPDSATHRMVFETDGQTVTKLRGGKLPEVEWVEGCS